MNSCTPHHTLHIHMHTHTHAHTHMPSTCTHTHTHTHMPSAHVHTHTHVHTHAHTHTYTHMHTHTHIHTRAHTHTHTPWCCLRSNGWGGGRGAHPSSGGRTESGRKGTISEETGPNSTPYTHSHMHKQCVIENKIMLIFFYHEINVHCILFCCLVSNHSNTMNALPALV